MNPAAAQIGQHWAAWTPGRQQWLLMTVTVIAQGQATLKYDPRYGIASGQDECRVDEFTLLNSANLFRYQRGP